MAASPHIRRRSWSRAFGLAAMLVAMPRVALACPVCFGQTAAPLTEAINLGIVFMLGFVAAMLVAFALFFVRLARRARAAAASEMNAAPAMAGTALRRSSQC